MHISFSSKGFVGAEEEAKLLMERLETVGLALKPIAAELLRQVDISFATETAPGQSWKSLAESTQKQRQSLGFSPNNSKLKRKETLFDNARAGFVSLYSIANPAMRHALVTGNSYSSNGANYAAVQQHGNSNIPARPFFPEQIVVQEITYKEIIKYLSGGNMVVFGDSSFTPYASRG